MTRYWFNETTNTAFALDVPPPDGNGVLEIEEADYKEIMAAQPAPEPMQPQSVPPTTMVNMEKLASVWRKMQDSRDNLKRGYETQDKIIEDQQKQVSSALLDAMNKIGGTKLLTAAGQIEKKKKIHLKPQDWGAIYRFVKVNDAWEMLHKRLSNQFVERYSKEHKGALPPGIDVFSEFVVSVKKPGAKDTPSDEE